MLQSVVKYLSASIDPKDQLDSLENIFFLADCTAPFAVAIVTDAALDQATEGDVKAGSRGKLSLMILFSSLLFNKTFMF